MFIPGGFQIKNFHFKVLNLLNMNTVKIVGILKFISMVYSTSKVEREEWTISILGSYLPEARSFLHHLEVWWSQTKCLNF